MTFKKNSNFQAGKLNNLNESLIYLAKKLNFTKRQTAALDSSVALIHQGQINKLFTFVGLLSAEETNSVPCSGIVKVILNICRYCNDSKV